MTAKNAKSAKSRGGAKGKSEVPPTLATGAETATGTAIAQGAKQIPKGAKRGSTVEIVGGEPQPDADGPQKPRGDQAEPARFTSNGQIPEGTVASTAGPIPVSVIARDQDHADELLDQKAEEHQAFLERRVSGKRLDEHTNSRLTGPELRAIGQQRGYDINDTAGTRATRAAFSAAQSKDKNLKGK